MWTNVDKLNVGGEKEADSMGGVSYAAISDWKVQF